MTKHALCYLFIVSLIKVGMISISDSPCPCSRIVKNRVPYG